MTSGTLVTAAHNQRVDAAEFYYLIPTVVHTRGAKTPCPPTMYLGDDAVVDLISGIYRDMPSSLCTAPSNLFRAAVAYPSHLALEIASAPSVSVDLVPQILPRQHLTRLEVEGV